MRPYIFQKFRIKQNRFHHRFKIGMGILKNSRYPLDVVWCRIAFGQTHNEVFRNIRSDIGLRHNNLYGSSYLFCGWHIGRNLCTKKLLFAKVMVARRHLHGVSKVSKVVACLAILIPIALQIPPCKDTGKFIDIVLGIGRDKTSIGICYRCTV